MSPLKRWRILVAYLKAKLAERDWHGVRDAAADLEPPRLTAWMRLKLAALWLGALVAPGVALPAAKRVRGEAPVEVTQGEFEDDVDLDEDYQGEQFYRGLPIFDKKNERCTLNPGKTYHESFMQLSNGLVMQCWREKGAPHPVIDKSKIPQGQ